jgi:hypothetical protein
MVLAGGASVCSGDTRVLDDGCEAEPVSCHSDPVRRTSTFPETRQALAHRRAKERFSGCCRSCNRVRHSGNQPVIRVLRARPAGRSVQHARLGRDGVLGRTKFRSVRTPASRWARTGGTSHPCRS